MIVETMKNEIEMWKKIGGQPLMQEYILTNGREFETVQAGERGTPKECFRNASLFVLERKDRYSYVEGYAMISKEIPLLIHHAWVYDNQEEISLEVTTEAPMYEYFGVLFSPSEMTKWLLKNGVYGIIDTGSGFNFELMGM